MYYTDREVREILEQVYAEAYDQGIDDTLDYIDENYELESDDFDLMDEYDAYTEGSSNRKHPERRDISIAARNADRLGIDKDTIYRAHHDGLKARSAALKAGKNEREAEKDRSKALEKQGNDYYKNMSTNDKINFKEKMNKYFDKQDADNKERYQRLGKKKGIYYPGH